MNSKNTPHKIPFLDLLEENFFMLPEIEAAVIDVVRSGRYLHGPHTAAFEDSLAKLCGVEHVVGVSNGLDALRLIFRGYIELGRLAKGDEVIYPANTYIASILPLDEFGLIGKGVEPTESDYNLDFKNVADALTARTKAVLAVHLYGNPCWDAEVAAELRRRNILIIEDNAQGIGALAAEEGFNGTCRTGGLGDAAAFSFYPTKNIGALGDAGAVATSDAELAKTVRALANYGSDRRYHNIYKGYNCRIDEIQTAALNVKLKHLDEITSRRRKIAEIYDSKIQSALVIKPKIFTDRTQVWHQYVILAEERDRLREYLAQNGIATDIHYAVPPHLQPCYNTAHNHKFPLTENLSNRVISLPIAGITEQQAIIVADTLNNYEQQHNN